MFNAWPLQVRQNHGVELHTHLTYEHVENPTSKVSDEWTIVQAKHGPFDPKDHTFLPPRK